jgi:formamidopyrimidine-DNA glycosylase
MPELPEVEIVRTGLSQLIIGKIIKKVSYDNLRSFPNDKADVGKFIISARVVSVKRRAKVLLIELSSNYTLMIHLRMTGQLVFEPLMYKNQKMNLETLTKKRFAAGHPSDSMIGKLPDKSTRVIFYFTDESKLYFNDQRKFGSIKLLLTELVNEDAFIKKVGPEPLSRNFSNKIFVQRIRKRNSTTVKAAILDQTILAGVGNIYADESLWAARINPNERVKNITDDRLNKLHMEIKNVMKLAIQKGGSTAKNYVNAEGKKGSYLEYAKVFNRQNMPCKRCGSIIEKSRVAGRGTYICPTCQKITFKTR